MIQISLKGLAKFMNASAAGQRKALHDYKFPAEEGQAQAKYYRDARNAISKYHEQKHPESWLLQKAADLLLDAQAAPKPQIATRLRNNARAIKSYAAYFPPGLYEVLSDVKLALNFGNVLVTVNPDLRVRERGKEKLLKLDFATDEPDATLITIISQAMLEAALADGMELSSSQVLYVDVPRGVRHKGARLGARMRTNIEAACQNIAAIWNTI